MKTFLVIFLVSITLRAEPHTPKNNETVLEKLPRGFKPAPRTVDLTSACAEARNYIQLARQTAEPRFLGYAQGSLSHWINQTNPPSEVLLLRAIIRQSNHDFDSALRDLDRLPQDRPTLTAKIAVLLAQGKINEARVICQRAPWLGVDVIAAVTSLNGQLQPSLRLLKANLAADDSWGWVTLAEMAVRAGDSRLANEAFDNALRLVPDDLYLLAAYADFLIDQKEFTRVISLLEPKRNVDGLLLRLTIARKKANLTFEIDPLKERFNAARQSVGALHAREEAMFHLHVLDQPGVALELAEENWQKQREPLDARVLLEAARAANSPTAASPMVNWIKENKVEDVRLANLL